MKEEKDNLEQEKDSVAEPEQKTDSDETSPQKEDHTEAEEKSAGSPKLLIAEIIIAAVAVGFIVFALVTNNKNNGSVSGNTASGNMTSGNFAEAMVIDNSALYEDIPALPAMSELNKMTQAEADAAVEEGTMIQLTTGDGVTIYVNNYTDPDYLGESVIPTDEEIDELIFQNLIVAMGERTETTHTTVERGDIIDANFVGMLDGVAFEGGSAENVEIIIGEGGYIPGFEEGFTGMSVGESKDVPMTFPEDYFNEEMAGKDVVFTLTVNAITGTMSYPELTDELVTQAFADGSVTTVAGCREFFKTNTLDNNVWNFLFAQYYVPSLSEETVHGYYNSMMEYYDQMSQAYQTSMADLMAMNGDTLDTLRQDVMTSAAYSALQYTICETVAATTSLAVTDADIAALASEYGYDDAASFVANNGEDTIREYLTEQKVIDYIKSLLQ